VDVCGSGDCDVTALLVNKPPIAKAAKLISKNRNIHTSIIDNFKN
jgi:hypothetical protein